MPCQIPNEWPQDALQREEMGQCLTPLPLASSRGTRDGSSCGLCAARRGLPFTSWLRRACFGAGVDWHGGQRRRRRACRGGGGDWHGGQRRLRRACFEAGGGSHGGQRWQICSPSCILQTDMFRYNALQVLHALMNTFFHRGILLCKLKR